jgi:hypothetical protein
MQFVIAPFGKGAQGVGVGVGMVDSGRSQLRNFLSRKLLLPLGQPGAAGVKYLDAIAQFRLLLQDVGDQG